MNRQLKVSIYVLCLLLVFGGGVYAETTIAVRSGAFFPAKNTFRHVYGDVSSFVEFEATTPVFCDYNLWANTDIYRERGSVHGCGRSRVEITTFSLGLKRGYCLNRCVELYLGLGASFTGIVVKNTLGNCRTHSRKGSVGGVIKSGVYLHATDCIFFDLFADYYYQPVKYHHTTNCGGFKLGCGLGYVF